MIKIAVCDDDVLITQTIENEIKSLCAAYRVPVDIQIFYSGEQLYRCLNQKEYFDMIYLDIKMYELNGVQLGKKLREELNNESTLLIYVSACNDYFVELFEVDPFRFLTKPIDPKQFDRIFDSALQNIFKKNISFEFKIGQTVIKQPIKNIIYFESRNRQINVVTVDGIYTYYDKLSNVIEKLDQRDFILIHKSYYVNFDHVRELHYSFVVLSNQEKLNISEQRRSIVRNEYIKLKRRMQHENT
jgi:DNA-binding LytR/AlgR family response regulator